MENQLHFWYGMVKCISSMWRNMPPVAPVQPTTQLFGHKPIAVKSSVSLRPSARKILRWEPNSRVVLSSRSRPELVSSRHFASSQWARVYFLIFFFLACTTTPHLPPSPSCHRSLRWCRPPIFLPLYCSICICCALTANCCEKKYRSALLGLNLLSRQQNTYISYVLSNPCTTCLHHQG